MRQHPLDGQMGLAGIGRPEDRGDADAAGASLAVGRRGEGDGHGGNQWPVIDDQ
jgi:hypothetical protein